MIYSLPILALTFWSITVGTQGLFRLFFLFATALLAAALFTSLTLSQAFWLCILLLLWMLILRNTHSLISRLFPPPHLPALAIACFAALLACWLLWPILFSQFLTAWPAQLITWLISLNPLFLLTGILSPPSSPPAITPWTELPWVYRNTSLGQDVPYALPRSLLPLAVLALLLSLLARIKPPHPRIPVFEKSRPSSN